MILMKSLMEVSKKIKLLVVGDGPDAAKYHKLAEKLKISDNVIFTGKVPWEEVPNYYQIASVFATASTTETQGLTVIEAMAASIPPLCIDDESFRNVVVDGLNGKIFKNKRQYKKQVEELIENKEELKMLSKQARRNAEQHSAKYYAERVLDVYKIAINNQPKYKYDIFGRVKNIIKGNEDE